MGKPARALAAEKGVKVDRMIGIYMGSETLRIHGFDIYPVNEFLRRLHAGDIF